MGEFSNEKKKNGTKLISKIDESILILLYNSKNFIKFKKQKAIFENIKTLITSTFVHDDDIHSHSHLVGVNIFFPSSIGAR